MADAIWEFVTWWFIGPWWVVGMLVFLVVASVALPDEKK